MTDKNKKIVWSYTNISKFETCPRQWYSQYILKDIPFIPNEATTWGNDVHTAFDIRFKTGVKMQGRFKEFEKEAQKLEAIPGVLHSEYELVIDDEGNHVDWWNKNAVMRGKTDVQIFFEDKSLLVDWKTGKRRSSEELEFFSLLTFKLHPEVEKIKTCYSWFKEGKEDFAAYTRPQNSNQLNDKFEEKIYKIENAIQEDRFPKIKSGLCQKYCGSPSCEYSGNFKMEAKQ